MTQEQYDLIEKLRAEVCEGCGGVKRYGRSFCYTCYRSLPRALQAALWSHLGNGYEEAYREACERLEERLTTV